QSCYSSPGPVTSLRDDRVAMMAAPGDLVQWVMVSLPPGSKTASRCRYTAWSGRHWALLVGLGSVGRTIIAQLSVSSRVAVSVKSSGTRLSRLWSAKSRLLVSESSAACLSSHCSFFCWFFATQAFFSSVGPALQVMLVIGGGHGRVQALVSRLELASERLDESAQTRNGPSESSLNQVESVLPFFRRGPDEVEAFWDANDQFHWVLLLFSRVDVGELVVLARELRFDTGRDCLQRQRVQLSDDAALDGNAKVAGRRLHRHGHSALAVMVDAAA
ncbi:hypothetical protein TYRP_019393, partial [Tyrophagus putrescentiae]